MICIKSNYHKRKVIPYAELPKEIKKRFCLTKNDDIFVKYLGEYHCISNQKPVFFGTKNKFDLYVRGGSARDGLVLKFSDDKTSVTVGFCFAFGNRNQTL